MQVMKILLVLSLLVACSKGKPDAERTPPSPTPTPAPLVPVADGGVQDAASSVADASVVDAAPRQKIACTAKTIATARKQADGHVKAGRFDEAIALLDGDACYLESEQEPELQEQIAWRLSDLSLAYYKAGRYGDCYSLTGRELSPYAGNIAFFMDGPVIKALEYNQKLCSSAIEKERGAFVKAGECKGGYSVPKALLAAGVRSECVQQGDQSKDSDDLVVCGKITVVTTLASGKTVPTPMNVVDGNLTDSSVCCNVESVGFAKQDADWTMLVKTEGKDCNGGTASSEEQMVYKRSGDRLEVVHAVGASFH
jgi:hypothetical protein